MAAMGGTMGTSPTAPNPVGMTRVGRLYDDGVDHRQIQAGGHAIVQERGVLHTALGVEEVFFVQGPTDTLDHAALHLPFDVTGMDCLARVLHHGVVENGDLSSVNIDLDVRYLGAKRSAGALGD